MNISDIFIDGALVLDDQTFNASGTWTKPTGIVFLPGDLALIDLWGGGRGGNTGVPGSSSRPFGGAGGDFLRRVVPLTSLGASESVVVGAGGAGGTYAPGNGSDGGSSSFAGMVAAGGKVIGGVGADPVTAFYGRINAKPLTTIYTPGDGVSFSSGVTVSSPAGTSIYGGDGGSYSVVRATYYQGLDGQAPGGGGGATSTSESSTNVRGGNGAPGRVRIRILRGVSQFELGEYPA